MKRFWSDVWWVAVYELGEAVRTRLFQLVLLAYAGGIAASGTVLVLILKAAEDRMAETLGMPATIRPGAMMGKLLENGELAGIIARFVGTSDADAAKLLHEPILGLWTGVTSMALLPLVLVFSSSGSIASEVRSRSVRYLLCRTGRLQIGLGKLAGQLLIALVAVAIGGGVAWVLGMTAMVGNPPVGLALSIADRTLRSVLWALPFAGLGLAASQWVTSPNGARFLAGGMLCAMPVASGILHHYAGTGTVGRLCDLAGMFLATRAWDDYWSLDAGVVAAAALQGVVLAVVYYASGHVVFARRDL